MANKIEVKISAKDAFSRVMGKAIKSVKKLGAVVSGVAQRIKRFAIIGVGAVGAIGFAALRAAGQYEMLRLQLETVTGSAEKAVRIFNEIRRFAAATPLQLEDLVRARILLEGVGVTGQKALKNVAQAAAALDRDILDVASAIVGLEGEPLRRLGLTFNKTGNEARLSFRDKTGKEIVQVIHGLDNMRTALLEAFGTKFEGALGRASKSLFGLVSTLKDNFKDAMATVGDQFLDTAKRGVGTLIARIQELVTSGQLAKWADAVHDRMVRLGDILAGLFDRVREGKGSEVAAAFGNVIVAAFKDGAAAAAPIIIKAIKDGFGPQHMKGLESIKDSHSRRFGPDADAPPPSNLSEALADFVALAGNASNVPFAPDQVQAGKDAASFIDSLVNPFPGLPKKGGGTTVAPPTAGKFSSVEAGELFARAYGQSNANLQPGSTPTNPLFVSQVNNPEGGLD